MTNLAYVVNSTEFLGDVYVLASDPVYFATRENAVAHAEGLTGAKENSGEFVGEWQACDDLMLFAQGEDQMRKRTIATVETVTIDEIEAAL